MPGNMGYLDGNLASLDVSDEITGIPAAPTVEIRAILTSMNNCWVDLKAEWETTGQSTDCSSSKPALEEMLMLCLLIHQRIDWNLWRP